MRNPWFLKLFLAWKPRDKPGGIKDLEIDKSITTLKGRCASRGKVTGQARVVRSPDDFTKFQQNEILVVMNTSPDFVPIMKLAKAIVAEEGGLTSHVAIVSREMNVPSVIGIGHATDIIHDGDLLEVDADLGIVRIVS